MKFTFSWLKEHLNTTSSLDEVVDALTDLGLEVEEVRDPIRKLNDLLKEQFIVQNEQNLYTTSSPQKGSS